MSVVAILRVKNVEMAIKNTKRSYSKSAFFSQNFELKYCEFWLFCLLKIYESKLRALS
jgi:hypothetical protein